MTQSSIADFGSNNGLSQQDNTNEQTDARTQSSVELDSKVDTQTVEFTRLAGGYPEEKIKQEAKEVFSHSLQTKEGTVKPSFSAIAGRKETGPPGVLDNAEAARSIASQLIGQPIILTGGGLGMPGGAQAIFGKLEKVFDTNGLKINFEEIYRLNGPNKTVVKTRRIGAYQLSVPTTEDDRKKAVAALEQFQTGDVEYIDPVKHSKESLKRQQISAFKELSPGDTVLTPEYATTLTVVSHPFDTYAVIPRGDRNNIPKRVTAVVVNNPRGGYYQLGISETVSRYSNKPVCYMSGSDSHPPTPNTAFTRSSGFDSTDVEITTINDAKDVDVVQPDEEILNSPLPEPRMQTSLSEIEGVGEKTRRKIWKISSGISVDSLAHTLYGEGDEHKRELRSIKKIIDSLPSSEKIYEQIKSYTPGDDQ